MKLVHATIQGQGRPLIILHGFLGMSDNWKTLANKFAESMEVHLVDQRNHGRSFHDSEFNYDVMADDLRNYLHEKGLEKVSIIGHSMGGKTAMLFSCLFPEMVEALVVADIAPKFYPQHHQDILAGLQAVDFDQANSRGDIDKMLEPYIPEFGVRQFLMKNVYRKEKDRFAFRFALDTLVEEVDEVGEALPTYARYPGPVLFLKGENSGYIAEQDKVLIKDHFPQAKLEVVAKAGHWLHAENPQEFYTFVARFFKIG